MNKFLFCFLSIASVQVLAANYSPGRSPAGESTKIVGCTIKVTNNETQKVLETQSVEIPKIDNASTEGFLHQGAFHFRVSSAADGLYLTLADLKSKAVASSRDQYSRVTDKKPVPVSTSAFIVLSVDSEGQRLNIDSYCLEK